ncbi:hypothetical protein LOTGIDRAFT_172652 [Lottia gigantea]|uniref:Uncharacterized protein n=1 Tax=Lottia gigantea TaxID=225164 RepID=V4AVT3_LOTGI|nr:hypothetical protein LOTGIDRAFT_172652 [Lottia gigantea]ESP01483.1 hypothetical protein LOTGIDRAFT_172652 [Lottia gigantea]
MTFRSCNAAMRYRTIDGTCNNLHKPRDGSFKDTLLRLVPNAYEDGKSLPRFNGFDGYLLPSAGEISQKVLTNVSEPALTSLTNLHQVFGQFLAHDIVLTKTMKTSSGGNYKCCKDTGIDETLGLRGEPCYPIKWPNPVGDHGCGNFVRTVGEIDCKSHIREPINFLTAFVDGSGVYGSTKDESHSLRSFVGGKLTKSAHDLLPARGNPHDKSNCILFTENDFCFDAGKLTISAHALLPARSNPDDKSNCILFTDNDFCFDAGDKRVNEVSGLTALHIVFMRYHNLIAQQLSTMNPSLDDEILFQETRRIIVAIIQKITYHEYLPLLIGPAAMSQYGLTEPYSYNPNISPGIFSSFSAAAFRYGHSSVPNKWTNGNSRLPLGVMFQRPYYIQIANGTGYDHTMKGMLIDSSQEVDLEFNKAFQVDLFNTDAFAGNTLAAINIQRGRDFGLPSYNTFREACGLPRLNSFDNGSAQFNRLQMVYSHVDDVDLYIGGLSEDPVTDGIVGPTFACIIGQQFNNLKFGDRFWFENAQSSGFSQGQMNAIRNLTFSRVICDTAKIERIPTFAFLHENNSTNILVECSDNTETPPSMNIIRKLEPQKEDETMSYKFLRATDFEYVKLYFLYHQCYYSSVDVHKSQQNKGFIIHFLIIEDEATSKVYI